MAYKLKSDLRFFRSWYQMMRRCYEPNSTRYEHYGGRGISVCKRWHNFQNFKKDMKPSFKDYLTIERIYNDGDYNLKNCKWATHKEQSNNTRRNKFIFWNGIKKTLNQWSEYLKIKRSTLAQRYYVYKWDVNKCFTFRR